MCGTVKIGFTPNKLLFWRILNEKKGTVKWFNAEKDLDLFLSKEKMMYSYIFLLSREGFKTLEEGQAVEFDVVEGAEGPQAANVSKL